MNLNSIKKSYPDISHCQTIFHAFEYAAENNYLHIVRVLCPDMSDPIRLDAFYSACTYGQLEVAEFLIKFIFDHIDVSKHGFFKMLMATCANGHLYIIKWLDSMAKINTNDKFRMLYESCSYGKLNVIKWLLEQQKIDSDVVNNAAYYACASKHLHVVEYLVDNYNVNFNFDVENLFIQMSINGHLHLIKKIADNIDALNIQTINWCFFWACQNDRLEIAQFWYDYYTNEFTQDKLKINQAFVLACENGSLDRVKWLYSLYNNIDIEFEDTVAFRKACANGHLSTSIWLAHTCPDLNYKALDSYVIQKACENNHLQMVMWLTDKWPDIYDQVNIEQLFRRISTRNTQILKYLYEKYPTIDYTYDNHSMWNYSCSFGSMPTIEWLLTIYDVKHINALCWISIKNSTEILVKVLNYFDIEDYDGIDVGLLYQDKFTEVVDQMKLANYKIKSARH